MFSGDVWKVCHNYVASWVVNLIHLFLRQNYVINGFLLALHVEITYGITYGNYVSFLFVIFVCYFLFHHNYVIYFFDLVTFFENVGINIYFGTFNYVWKWRENYVSFLFVIVAYFWLYCNYVICLFDVVMFFEDLRIC